MKSPALPKAISKSYTLLRGDTVSLAGLSQQELKFLKDLLRLARNDVDYFEICAKACGPGSLALRGYSGLTRAIAQTPLYQAASDLAIRAGIHQHLVLAPEHEHLRSQAPTDGSTLSVTQAADLLLMSRAAVHKAIKAGKIRFLRVGNVILVDRQSVLDYGQRPAKAKTAKGSSRHAHGSETHPLPVAAKGITSGGPPRPWARWGASMRPSLWPKLRAGPGPATAM